MSARATRSLASRLRLAAIVAIAAALVSAAIAIGMILQRFVVSQVDQRLDTQISALASALRIENGQLVASPALNAPPYDNPRSGWLWQATSEAGDVTSRSLAGVGPLPLPELHVDWKRLVFGLSGVGDGPGPDGRPVHWRVGQRVVDDVPVTIATAAPIEAIRRPLGDALVPLVGALLVLGVLLVAAMWWQVRLGLRPLERLREAVAGVRNGSLAEIPTDQPQEVAPLVGEVNKLLADNAEGLSRARRHAANLAHGLKTPLARLDVTLAGMDLPDKEALRGQIALMDRLIRHHLTRARSAARSGPARASILLATSVDDLVELIRAVSSDRALTFAVDIDRSLFVACEKQDLDEILGNLLDNAAKWARSAITVTARGQDDRALVTIADDGPGLSDGHVPEALRPGFRIDEATPGYGFGLPIAAELTELYGGSLSLSRAAFGGLQVEVRLPLAR